MKSSTKRDWVVSRISVAIQREMAQRVVRDKAIPICLACEAFRVSEYYYRYEVKNNAENELIANWLIRLTDNNRSWGFGFCYL